MAASKLKLQQLSEWEQLWDDRRHVLYYYNKVSKITTYEEPDAPVRPLVRDMRSSALIQAWPYLDQPNEKEIALAAAMGSNLLLCGVCKERVTVRVCYDCVPPIHLKSFNCMPYCFSCFSTVHSNDPERINHNFKEVKQQEDVQYLMCCECNDYATRKCMGILDEREIDDLCGRLQRASSQSWGKILSGANVGGERKLTMMMDQLVSEGGHNAFLTPSQLQQIRTMLERTRAECDDCYCDNCYKEVHAGGKRLSHRWSGFNAGAAVCSVCVRSPAERECNDCGGSIFCRSCFKVFHSKGRKRKHTSTLILEDIPDGMHICSTCNRRAGTMVCSKCVESHCNSCYECSHAKTHLNETKTNLFVTRGEPAQFSQPICTQCGEAADTKCIQCNDYYCSRTWMGNPGCFINFHSKGNRAFHKNVSLSDTSLLESAANSTQISPSKKKGAPQSKKNNIFSQPGTAKFT
jgi:hypothetical protein